MQLGPVGPLTSCLMSPVIIFCAINLSISFISNSFFFFSLQEDVVFLGLKSTKLLLESGNVYGPGQV